MILICLFGIYGDFVFDMADTWAFSESIEKYEDQFSKRLAYSWKRSAFNVLNRGCIMICVLVISCYKSPMVPI